MGNCGAGYVRENDEGRFVIARSDLLAIIQCMERDAPNQKMGLSISELDILDK